MLCLCLCLCYVYVYVYVYVYILCFMLAPALCCRHIFVSLSYCLMWSSYHIISS